MQTIFFIGQEKPLSNLVNYDALKLFLKKDYLVVTTTEIANKYKFTNKVISFESKWTRRDWVKYLDYLIESFVFYKVNRFDLKGRKQLATQEKYYLVDVGLLNILMGKDRISNRGHILENIVYLELLRRGNKIWTGTDRNSEVDFVCRTTLGDINYIQVAWQLSDEKTIEREFGALDKIKDNYPKLLLTTDSST